MPIKNLTEWHVEGEIWCPDCTIFFEFDGTPGELAKFIEDHDCEESTEGESADA